MRLSISNYTSVASLHSLGILFELCISNLLCIAFTSLFLLQLPPLNLSTLCDWEAAYVPLDTWRQCYQELNNFTLHSLPTPLLCRSVAALA